MTKKSKIDDLRKTDMKTLFGGEDIQDENVPVKVKSFGDASNNSFKTLFDEQDHAEKLLLDKFKSKKKNEEKDAGRKEEHKGGNEKKEKRDSSKEIGSFKNFDCLRDFAKNDGSLLGWFFDQDGVLYYDEESENYLLSVPHLLFFAYGLLEDKKSMVKALFPENSQPDQEKIYAFVHDMLSSSVSVKAIERGSFHRAEEGYKEVYTFAIVEGVRGGDYVDRMVRGRYDKKYKKYKVKIFAEQFLDLE